MMVRKRYLLFLAALTLSQACLAGITQPKKFFGFDIGDDYRLANYKGYEAYLRQLAKETNRIRVVSIGKTEEGREQLMAIVSDPANLRNSEKYRQIAQKLALGQIETEKEARKLAEDGKAVVWIDGGLHATEVLGAQQLIETVYRLVSAEGAETRRIRKDVITLLVHANPDGMDLVSDWYMRKTEDKERSMAGLPRLYQKYAGHDNNRDFYACNLSESTNMNHVLYRQWFPQILYNHHQTAPAGSVIFVPPFRGPFNYHVDPLAQVQTDLVGMAMHTRFVAEGKPGAVMRNAAGYQTWWNGGLRTTAYFHNVVGILTEAYGSPTPGRIAYTANKLVPTTDIPFPIEPQEWRFRQSIEYELTANYAILDFASRARANLLFNKWRMARNAIEKGKKDTWTFYPSRVSANQGGIDGLKSPAKRDAKGYVLSAGQSDFPTAAKFANMLIKNGVEVLRAKAAFSVGGKDYPQGSLIVRCDQAYRAHVLDMFEPQDYPNDFQYPGGPPIPPYDSAGYTLAYTMGVSFDRLPDPFDGPFAKIDGMAVAESDFGLPRGVNAGFEVSCRQTDSFSLAARMLKAGAKVWRMPGGDPSALPSIDTGNFVIEDGAAAETLAKAVKELGLQVSIARRAPEQMVLLKEPRLALLDRYGGSMESGWTRWILEQFHIPFTVVYPPEIDQGILKNFDALLLVSGMTFGGGRGAGVEGGGFGESPEQSPLPLVESAANDRGKGPGDGGSGKPLSPAPEERGVGERGSGNAGVLAPVLGGAQGHSRSLRARSDPSPGSPELTDLSPKGRGVARVNGYGAQGSLQSDPTIPAEWRQRMGSLTPQASLPKVKEFLEAGGTVVAIGSATGMGRQLGLPIASALTEAVEGRERPLPREKYYCPGSVLRVKVDNSLPAAWGMGEYADVMNDNSPAFKLLDGWEQAGIRKIAWYDTDRPLRSGWCWGQSFLKDAVAALEAPIGKGRLLLFGPEILFRGQTHGSFKFLFNALFPATR